MTCEDLEGMQAKMTIKFGCPLTKTRELLQISRQLQLNVVGVRYVSTMWLNANESDSLDVMYSRIIGIMVRSLLWRVVMVHP